MATIQNTQASADYDINVLLATWPSLANGDDGTPWTQSAAADRSVQIAGTFGVGGTVEIRGSNDGVNYALLTDVQGAGLSITTAKIKAITELTRYIKPVVVGGDGTTNLTITMLARK